MNISSTHTEQFSLSLTRDYQATREQVFQAWTNPELLTQWFGPKDVTTTNAQLDLKPGGKYQFTMKEPNGSVIHHGGEYLEVDPPNKLVFTWILEGQGCEGSEGVFAETRVTIEFQDMGGSTRLTLTHDFLPNDASKEAHYMGWTSSLDCLEEMVTN